MSAFRRDEDLPFHTEIGYIMWDAKAQQVFRCVMIPRAQVFITGGTVAPDATSFTLRAERGSTTYGILSNPYLEEFTETPAFEISFEVGADTFSYKSDATIKHKVLGSSMQHTDTNTLRLISRED
jgi:hypothetical protein